MAKKKQAEELPQKDTFMMMFVTLSLILLAFFILLNSMSVKDDERSRKALGSLLGSFGMLPSANSVDQGDEAIMREKSIVDNENMLKLFDKAKREIAYLIEETLHNNKDINFSANETKGEIKIVLSEQLLFAPGTAVISPKLFPLLQKIADVSREANGRTIVTGHTDSRPAGKGRSNWKLSLQRGTVIARHLEAAGQISSGKTRASGAAHHQPTADNKTAEGRATNRRVEILVKHKGAGTDG